MARVLLICPEPLGHGQPAGIGIRFIEMARVLIADGHAVTVMSRDGGAVSGAESVQMTPEAIAELTTRHDVAVVQGHAVNELVAHGGELPTVVDLYDPYIIENLHYYVERGAEVFQHDHSTLVRSLLVGDYFLCASGAQRLFYLGLMLAAGRLNPLIFADDPRLDRLIGIAPFGVQPERPVARGRNHDVLFGGIYDWYDPLLAIDAVAAARKSVPHVTLTFTLHPNPELTPQGKAADAIAYVERRGYDAFVRFEPWFAYAERGAFFDRFAIVLLTFPQSIETDLSMRTRVYDYLWGHLPIITSSAPGTDEIITRYNAGIVVREQSAEAFAGAIAEALRPDRLDSMIAGTSQFVAGQQWPDALRPLRDFCRSPRFDRHKREFAIRLELPERKPGILQRLKRRIGGVF